MGSQPAYETSRPCPVCGRDVDVSNVKPGGKTSCRSDAHPGRRVSVMRRRLPETQAGPGTATAGPWAGELPGVLDWPGPLGAESPDDDRCPPECGCSRPQTRYTADHTGTVCPECGPECWSVAMATYRRGRSHVAESATVAKVASSPAAQAELDAKARDMRRARDRLLRAIRAGLDTPRITADSTSDLEWFKAEVEQADRPGRLAQLAAELDGYTVQRDGWWRGAVELPGDDDDDQDQGDDQADDDMPAAVSRPQLRAITGGAWTDADYAREAQRRLDAQRDAAHRAAELKAWNRANRSV